MAQAILTSKVTVVTGQTLSKLRKSELVCESEKRKHNLFGGIIEKKLGSSMSYPENPIPESYTPYEDDSEEDPLSFPDDANPFESDSTAAFQNPVTYHIIHDELNIPPGKKIQGDKVIVCTKEPNGDNVGKYNDKPFLNSMLYDFEFPDGEIK